MDLCYMDKQSFFPRKEKEGLGTDPSMLLGYIKVPLQVKIVCLLAQHQEKRLNNSLKLAPFIINIDLRKPGNHWTLTLHLNDFMMF